MENENSPMTVDETKNNNLPSTKVYKRRWFMLFLYFIGTVLGGMQWAQYSSIANVIVDYYNVSYEAVNWTTIVFLLIYFPLIFPVSYVLQVLGLRYGLLSALLLTCLSCWLKVLAVSPTRFWLVIVSQCIGAAAMPLILSALTLLTAEWFNLNQISTASSIGVLAYQLGCGTGFIVPTFTIPTSIDLKTFEYNFYLMLLAIAVFSTVYLVIFFIFFQNKPPLPPSKAKLKNEENFQSFNDFLKIIATLCKKPSFIIVLIICGITSGVCTAVDTLLNQMMIPYYEDASIEAGRIGFSTYGAAAFGPLVAGLVLDKYNHYRITFIITQLLFFFVLVAFALLFDKGILSIYITLSLLGFFSAAVDLISLETVIEITYPIPESVCSGCIFGIYQCFSVSFIYCYSWIFYNFQPYLASIFLCVFGGLAVILTWIVKFKYHRQNAQSRN